MCLLLWYLSVCCVCDWAQVHVCVRGLRPVGWPVHWSADRVLHIQPLQARAGGWQQGAWGGVLVCVCCRGGAGGELVMEKREGATVCMCCEVLP